MRRSFMGLFASLILIFASQPFSVIADSASAHREVLLKLREDANAEELGILESYNEAVELEKEIAQMYREIRAATLSQIQRQSMKKSLDQTLLPISSRITPDGSVLKITAKSGDDVTRYQDELKKVMQESDAIVANAEEMLNSLLPERPEEETQESADALQLPIEEMTMEELEAEMQESPENSSAEENEQIKELESEADEKIEEVKESLDSAIEEIEEAESIIEEKLEAEKQAAQEEAQKEEQDVVEEDKKSQENIEKLELAKELIEAAKESVEDESESLEERAEKAEKALEAIAEALDASVDIDEKLKEEKQQDPQEHTEKAVEYLKEATEDMEAAAKALELAAKLSAASAAGAKAQEIAKQQALAALSQAAAGTALDITRQMKGKDLTIQPEPVKPEDMPPPIKKYFKNISGRKVVRYEGTPAVWFNVNKWYILGPYDNNGRMNLARVYPPESIIDLDAHYMGKDGAKLSWYYDSFVEESVSPSDGWGEYSIYYGYTELFFEDASDLWIAIGSDDRSDLWINDMPVWQSSNKLKAWVIDEGYRKVHFKKGRNKILFRLENGWHGMGFSLLINTFNPANLRE